MGLQFLARSLRDAQELDVGAGVIASPALGNVGWNRNRRAPYLRRQTKLFLAREVSCEPIAGLGQRHRFLPNAEVAIRLKVSALHIRLQHSDWRLAIWRLASASSRSIRPPGSAPSAPDRARPRAAARGCSAPSSPWDR